MSEETKPFRFWDSGSKYTWKAVGLGYFYIRKCHGLKWPLNVLLLCFFQWGVGYPTVQ